MDYLRWCNIQNIYPCYQCVTGNIDAHYDIVCFQQFWTVSSFSLYNTGLFEMIVGVLTTCHTQCIWDNSIFIFLFNRTRLQVFVTYLTGALYVHPLWFYKHQHDNRVRPKLLVHVSGDGSDSYLQFRDTCGKRKNINLKLDVIP